ncbi:hypothetical protein [Streptomyces cacaoi]|uniref:hypothetical protein n=1 Tax=Streptomyces cacaoi TaxID=1898 RepID=UPI002613E4E0|nr:hypothetical protein [Streptomyces cacaoi]
MAKKPLPVAERLAAAERDASLADIVARTSEWDRHLVLQAVYLVGVEQPEFSANTVREQLPELAHGHLGAAIKGLERGGIIEPTGVWVPSTSAATKGHRVAVWRLTARGRRLAQTRPATVTAPPRPARGRRAEPAQLGLFAA